MQLPTPMLWTIAAVLVVIPLVVLARILLRPGPPPYQAAQLLTAHEQGFYRELRRFADRRGLALLAKVRMADLLQVESGHRHYQSWFNRISQKHADFVLCNPKDLETLLVVELDDRSHDRPDRQERDRFVDSAYRAAGIPIAHVRQERGTALESLLIQALKHG